MMCSLSNLTKEDLDQIRTLESDLGKPLLAFSCHDLAPALLDAGNLARIQELEKKLGLALVAVENS